MVSDLAKASRSETINRIERLVDRQERRIGDSFLSSVRGIRDLATLEDIADRLERGQSLDDIFSEESIRNELATLGAAISASALAGASLSADLQDDGVVGRNGTVVNFVFNATNPRISGFAERVAATRVREMSNDVQGVIREVVRRETLAGTNPRDAARTIRQAIGLTARQEQAVRNYRAALESRDSAALQRALRDRRFDPTIARAIRNETPLSARQIERMTERYRERFVKYRSEAIARTEATRTVNGAAKEYLEGYIEEGTIAREQVRRFWHYTKDERTRVSHRQIPALNENGRGMDEPFRTPLGPLMYPGDPSAPPEMTVNCRCTVFQRVVSMELINQEVAA